MGTVIFSAVSLGGISVLLGLALSYAAIKFHVQEDPRHEEINKLLPGANCGGCGYPGCSAFAQALIDGEVKPNDCAPCSIESAKAIGAILGVEVKEEARKCAFILCGGGMSECIFRYDYEGMHDCSAMMRLAAGGSKSCSFGCLGGGTCESVCGFGAISIVDGIARVDNEKCTACGMCVDSCPKKIITMVPKDSKVRVSCHSPESGKAVRTNCKVGCIGCKQCEKVCKYDAVHVENLLAVIDYEKCTQCGDCVKKCPTHCIRIIDDNFTGDMK